jgi:hypothetical protein
MPKGNHQKTQFSLWLKYDHTPGFPSGVFCLRIVFFTVWEMKEWVSNPHVHGTATRMPLTVTWSLCEGHCSCIEKVAYCRNLQDYLFSAVFDSHASLKFSVLLLKLLRLDLQVTQRSLLMQYVQHSNIYGDVLSMTITCCLTTQISVYIDSQDWET